MCQDAQLNALTKAVLNDLSVVGTPAANRLSERLGKRFIPTDDVVEGLKLKAVRDFLILNDTVVDYGKIPAVVLGEAQSFIRVALSRFTWSHTGVEQSVYDVDLLLSLWKFGPGASNGVEGTHFCEKIRESMTCTEKALPLVRELRRCTPLLHSYDMKMGGCGGVTVIKGSRLSSVRKNADTDRTIAIEPSGNMALQLAAGSYITGALKRVGLSIDEQEPKNKYLAYLGSLTDDLCTIDLKNASDLISPWLIWSVWPTIWFNLFNTIRSPEINVGHGNWIKMKMMSTMGNGFTFPMMTLTLLALLYGFIRARGDTGRCHVDYSKIGVYGDDIICPTKYFSDFSSLLESCGLIINRSKSYSSGPFRESCGGDYWNGQCITPFYIESLQNSPEIYIAINKVLLWSSIHQVNMGQTLLYLKSLIEDERIYFVPEWHDSSHGVLSLYLPRTYKHLEVVQVFSYRKIKDDRDVLCLVAGYGNSAGEGKRHRMRYSPRCKKEDIVYEVKDAKLPQGHLDGHDPSYSDRGASIWRNRLITIFLK